MKRRPILAILTVLAAACSSNASTAATTTVVPTTEPTTTVASTTTVAPTTTGTVAPSTTVPVPVAGEPVLAFFVRDDRITPVRRSAPAGSSALGAAIEATLAGPTADEAAAGLSTAIPDGVRFRSVYVTNGQAFIDLDRSFESGGGTDSMLLRLAQLTATATSVDGVVGVYLRLDGTWVQTFSSEGIVLDHAWTIQDIDAQSPAILLQDPAPGDTVGAPLRLRGTSDVFEATFQVQVLDADGKLLADFLTMASSGTGTRGVFDVTAPVGDYTGPATIRLLEYSSKDGSETNVVETPIVIA